MRHIKIRLKNTLKTLAIFVLLCYNIKAILIRVDITAQEAPFARRIVTEVNMYFPFLSLDNLPGWVTDSFPIIRIVMMALMVGIALALIVLILFQPSSSSGMGALTGARDTFYSKDKSKSQEAVMKRLTVILGIVEGVLAILFFVTLVIYRG